MLMVGGADGKPMCTQRSAFHSDSSLKNAPSQGTHYESLGYNQTGLRELNELLRDYDWLSPGGKGEIFLLKTWGF